MENQLHGKTGRDGRTFLAVSVMLGALLPMQSLGADDVASEPQYTLSRHGSGRATGYAATNKIVTLGQFTHASWLDSQTGRFLVRIRSLDHKTGKWSSTHTIGEAFDNHGGPELTVDSRGYLHVVYYPHHHPFRYRRSIRPNDPSEWTPETSFGRLCTYTAMAVLPDDTLVLICRERTKTRWVMNQYTKPADGEWEGPQTLLHGNEPSGYTRWQTALAMGGNGVTLHMSFMIYEGELFGEVGPGYAIGYLRSRDGGRHWERSDGQPVTLPATAATIELVAGARRRSAPANLRPGNIAVDPSGTPWIVYSRLDRQPFETWIARPSAGEGWQRTPVLPVIQERWPGRSVKTPGQIVFDRDGTMYLALTTVRADISVKQAYWGHESAEVALLVSRDFGRTLQVYPISPPDDKVSNWLPSLERPTRHVPIGVPSLMYTHGTKGSNNLETVSNDVLYGQIP